MIRFSASLVLFNNSAETYIVSINPLIFSSNGNLLVIDNSSISYDHELFKHPGVGYIHTGENLGFGKAHNLAIKTVGNRRASR